MHATIIQQIGDLHDDCLWSVDPRQMANIFVLSKAHSIWVRPWVDRLAKRVTLEDAQAVVLVTTISSNSPGVGKRAHLLPTR